MVLTCARFLARTTAFVALAGAVASCSSKDTPPDFPDPDVAGHDTSPDGLPYPTDHIGGTPHHSKIAGDRIPNFTFEAYVDGDRTAGLKTISLADYFDPQQKRNKILHIEVSAVWCTICSSVTSETVKIKEELGLVGVVYLVVLPSWTRAGAGRSLGEVYVWVTRHQSNLPTAIDVASRRLGSIGVDPGVRPWDIVVDTRTMEILESSGGSPIDVATYDRSYLKAVASYAPAY
jgi:hypothetical protein